MGKTVLVTGGSGFLGSHTANALSRAGYKVRIFDSEPSPYLQDDQTMILGDITDAQTLKSAIQGCDYVYHFAGIADIERANENPVQTATINIGGTVQLLQACLEEHIKRFVFASTVYVYSDSGGFYRASKQASESFIELYQEKFGLDYTILRYGSLYGRRAGAENSIYKLIQSAFEKGELVYNGDPDAVRDYIHVADAARLSVDILDDTYANRHFILTGQERMRVSDLMRMIAEMMPNNPTLKFGEKTLSAHYVMTPYTYAPKLGHKLTSNDHIDLGQGLLDCITDIDEQLRQKNTNDPIVVTASKK